MPYVNSYQSEQFGKYITCESLVYWMHVAANKIIEELDASDIDVSLAQQYSDVYITPWRKSPTLVQQFYTNNTKTINNYLKKKIVCSMQDTLCFMKKLSTVSIHDKIGLVINDSKHRDCNVDTVVTTPSIILKPLLLTPVMIDQLLVTIKDVERKIHYNNLQHGIDAELYGDMDALSQMFSVYRNSFHIDRPDVTEGSGVYLTAKYIDMIIRPLHKLCNRVHKQAMALPTVIPILKFINNGIKILLSSYYPADYHNVNIVLSEQESWQRYVIKGGNEFFSMIMPYVREYSNKSTAYVLNMPLRVKPSVDCDNSMKCINNINEGSLSERYLLYYMTHAMLNPSSVTNVPIMKAFD